MGEFYLDKDDINRQLQVELADKHASVSKQAEEYMAMYGAYYLLSGGKGREWVPVNSDELKDVARQLKALGIKQYAVQCYGETEEEIDKLRYEGFLLKYMDKLNLPENGHITPEELKAQLQQTIDERGLTCGEFALQNMKKIEDGRKRKAYSEKDRSVYEYEASSRDWQLAAAGAWLAMGQGGKPFAEADVESAKNNVFARLCLRNKRTVEKLHRNEAHLFSEDFAKTMDSFTFKKEEDLRKAQQLSRNALNNMRALQGPYANSPEWQNLLKAADDFSAANNQKNAAYKSAELLVAVEKFTKGKKSKFNDEATQQMVDASLGLLSAAVPAATRNPSVKPLIDRFNDVRAHRLQSRVQLTDHGFEAVSEEAEKQAPRRKVSEDKASVDSDSEELSPVAKALYE